MNPYTIMQGNLIILYENDAYYINKEILFHMWTFL